MAVFLRPGIRLKPVNEILIHADGPLGIDLSGGIGFALQAVKTEDIPHMGFFSVFHHVLGMLRGDENDAADGAQHHVAVLADRLADPAEQLFDVAGIFAENAAFQHFRVYAVAAAAHLTETGDALVGVDFHQSAVHRGDDHVRETNVGDFQLAGS